MKDKKAYSHDVGKKLKEIRCRQGMTLADAAAASGLTSVAVRRYENGERGVSIDAFVKLACAYRDQSLLSYLETLIQSHSSAADGVSDHPVAAFTTREPFTRIEDIIDKCFADKVKLEPSLPDEDGMTRTLAEEIARTVRTAAVAVFKLDWREHRLVKIRNGEYLDQGVACRDSVDPAVEKSYAIEDNEYFFNGDHFTSLAWRDKDNRFIEDYLSEFHAHHKKVNPTSFKRHQALLGTVLSTMYGVISKTAPVYLMRCFNRSDFPNLPLDKIQYDLLSRLCEHASKYWFVRSAEHRLRVNNYYRDSMLLNGSDSLIANITAVDRLLNREDWTFNVFYKTAPTYDQQRSYSGNLIHLKTEGYNVALEKIWRPEERNQIENWISRTLTAEFFTNDILNAKTPPTRPDLPYSISNISRNICAIILPLKSSDYDVDAAGIVDAKQEYIEGAIINLYRGHSWGPIDLNYLIPDQIASLVTGSRLVSYLFKQSRRGHYS